VECTLAMAVGLPGSLLTAGEFVASQRIGPALLMIHPHRLRSTTNGPSIMCCGLRKSLFHS